MEGAASMETRMAGEADLPGAWALMERIVHEEFGYGWRPEWHWDIADTDALASHYLAHPRQALFVAVEDGTVIGTTGVRKDGPAAPPHPRWLAQRYIGPEAGQLARVWVAPEHRRRGIARTLVEQACAWAASVDYRLLALHTDTSVPGAEAFWRSLPATEVYDPRTPDDEMPTLHLELVLGAHGLVGAGQAEAPALATS
jgi:GNAT superfamily N-acetyltransferase